MWAWYKLIVSCDHSLKYVNSFRRYEVKSGLTDSHTDRRGQPDYSMLPASVGGGNMITTFDTYIYVAHLLPANFTD